MCADLGLSLEPRDDHAAYLAHWLTVLQGDKRAIFTAAAHAQRAVDYLHQEQNGEKRRQARASVKQIAKVASGGELSRMLDGVEITATTRKHARKMLAANAYEESLPLYVATCI